MKHMTRWLALTALLLGGQGPALANEAAPEASRDGAEQGFLPLIPEPGEDGYIHLEWDSLMPANFGAQLTDEASSGVELVQELIGKKVSIPGFVVPLDLDGESVVKFLFVPYMGACIHVPPPPPNQLIYAEINRGLVLEDPWMPLEIYGTLGAEYVETDLGAAGYTMDVDTIMAFEY